MKEILAALQQQQELSKKKAQEVNNLGSLFQRLTQLDYIESAASCESSNGSSSSPEEEKESKFAMIKRKSTSDKGFEIKNRMTALAKAIDQNQASSSKSKVKTAEAAKERDLTEVCIVYLREKIAQLMGIVNAISYR